MKRLLSVCLLLALCALPCFASPDPPQSRRFHRIADRYFASSFALNPTDATETGFHQYDATLDDFSRAAVARNVFLVQKTLADLATINPRKLSALDTADDAWLQSSLHGTLLDLQTIRPWQTDPGWYSDGITQSVYCLMSRRFAPGDVRLRAVIGRERSMPQALLEGRRNLHNPPRVTTQIALQDLPGTISFFQHDLPSAFTDVHDPELQAKFAAVNTRVIAALRLYETFVKRDVLPHAHGEFRLGAKTYRKKLLYDEMVSTPLPQLLAMGYADLHRNQKAFAAVARQIDPMQTPKQILAAQKRDHPTAEGLIPAFHDTLSGLEAYVLDHHIVSLPSRTLPVVEETPPFKRTTTFASTDTPGSFEHVATEAYFNVTPVDPRDPPAEQESYLQSFNRGTIISVAVHEAMPGHFVQFLWNQRTPSRIRKMLYSGTDSEGWAHYCEQMMLDEGYGGGDLHLRLGQLQAALRRDARFIVAIQMHTQGMSMTQARAFFQTEGYQTHAAAVRETLRGTGDPTYLVYTLGKLQILQLRADYRRQQGRAYSLQKFHDAFLAQGIVPIALIRRALLRP